jgi:outer membrane receptor for ferrienterochelin and colicins
VYHLGASYAASDAVTFTARINNLFDQDFTTYDLEFAECDSGTSCILDANGTNGYQASYVDHFNNKDKARNLWMSVNVSF